MALALDPAELTRIEQRMAAECQAMPAAEALGRLLEAASWLVIVGQDGRIRAIQVLGRRRQPAVTARARASRPAVEAAELRDGRIVLGHGSPVALRVEAGEVTPQQLLDVALRDVDPVVRSDAVRVGLRVLATDRDLERTILETLDGFDDDALARVLATAVGAGSEDLVLLLAKEGGDHPIGRRARALVGRVGGNP
jgi:hypothetical protein